MMATMDVSRMEPMLVESSRAPLRLGLPVGAVERWFPRLYPVDAGGQQ